MSGIILPPFIGAPEEAPASSSGLLVYDEIWVREPRLMFPRKTPIGNVMADPSHWVSQTAQWAYLTRDMPGIQYPIISHRAAILTPVTPQFGVTASGAGAFWVNGSQCFSTHADFTPFLTSNGAQTGAFSILVVASPKASGSASRVFASRRSASPTNAVIVAFNGKITQGGTLLNSESGSFVAYISSATNDMYARGVVQTSIVDGNTHAWMFTKGELNIFNLYCDGKFVGTQDQTVVDPEVFGHSNIFLGGSNVNTTTGITEPASLFIGWDQEISSALCCSLTEDPFCWCIPK